MVNTTWLLLKRVLMIRVVSNLVAHTIDFCFLLCPFPLLYYHLLHFCGI
jgi:hypothetical protein